MPRENAGTKARRLLIAGRVMVLEARGRWVRAYVRGDSGVYEVMHQDGAWSCDCACLGRCSHVQSVMWCTAPGRPR